MKSVVKLTEVERSIKARPDLWKGRILNAWQTGSQAGYGFTVGDEYDNPAQALVKEGYRLIARIDNVVVATDGLNSVVAAANVYGPWAVDITEALTNDISCRPAGIYQPINIIRSCPIKIS